MNVLPKKFKKSFNFIGAPKFKGTPVFLNSLPKSGTNLIEQFFINVGYKRNLSRCLNESNIHRSRISPSLGRFYVGHLFDDALVDQGRFWKVFVKRDLWSCLRSYVNYMYIDTSHPVSPFILHAQDLSSVSRLFFTSDNPNGRPLVSEYLRFCNLKMSEYSLIIDYDEFVEINSDLVSEISGLLGINESSIADKIKASCEEGSYTKNTGRFDFFKNANQADVHELKERVDFYKSRVGQRELFK